MDSWYGMERKDKIFGWLFRSRMDEGKIMLMPIGMDVSSLTYVLFPVDLVNWQKPKHANSQPKSKWRHMFECGLASEGEKNGRRGTGRSQEIARQFHFGLVSWFYIYIYSLRTFFVKLGIKGKDFLFLFPFGVTDDEETPY